MGKGGDNVRPVLEAAPLKTSNVSDDKSLSETSILIAERKEKVAKEANFHWDHHDEPHVWRRKAILKAHPEIRQLMGHDASTKWKVLGALFLQVAAIHLLQGAPWYTWLFVCYTLGGTVNHSQTIAMHEISHNLGAKKPLHNKLLAMMANLSMCVPAAASFKRYHFEHHRYQGEVEVDCDLPTNWEGWFFHSSARKAFWCFLQPGFYALRPLLVNPKKKNMWEMINICVTVVFNLTVYYFYGLGGVMFLFWGMILGMGLHPVAGHFLSEHLVMHEGQETYSYYGPLNWFTYNVGYHNEHHDFAFISAKNLPRAREVAPEYYDEIRHYHSWTKVLYDYIFDRKLSPYSRTKRVMLENKEIKDLRSRGGLVK